MEKQVNKPQALDSYKLYAEDSHPKHYTSPHIGKKKSWNPQAFTTAKNAVFGFVLDVIAAVKQITRRVL